MAASGRRITPPWQRNWTSSDRRDTTQEPQAVVPGRLGLCLRQNMTCKPCGGEWMVQSVTLGHSDPSVEALNAVIAVEGCRVAAERR
jgi:hypothetical protein